MNFCEIDKHIIPLEKFNLYWRFTDEKYDLLSDDQLQEIKPFGKEASLFLNNFLVEKNIHNQLTFNPDLYSSIDKVKITDGNEKEIKNWLYERDLPLENTVYLSWDGATSMKTKWKFVIDHWNSIYYAGSDDLTIFDESLKWTLLFFHESEIYWGQLK